MNQHHSAFSEILENFFLIFEILFTPYTKPKLAKIRPKMGFSQTIPWLYHSALVEILEIKKNEKKIFRVWQIIHPFILNPI